MPHTEAEASSDYMHLRTPTMPYSPQVDSLFDGSMVLQSSLEPKSKPHQRKTPVKSLEQRNAKRKRTPPNAAQAKLREYERRSRQKRENTILKMKDMVSKLEDQIKARAQQPFTNDKRQSICDLAVESMHLKHQNYHLKKAIDDHHFFHTMLQIEYEHREAPAEPDEYEVGLEWKPVHLETCYSLIRESFEDIQRFSESENFISSGLEICGWREKRKLCGNVVKFLFHKQFPMKECSKVFADRSFQMRAVQDQVSRYFGPQLNVHIDVIQRLSEDTLVVRRKITHTVDGWIHHTIYLLFRLQTSDGYLVCIRDVNPSDAGEHMPPMSEELSNTSVAAVIWSNCTIWWKFTKLPQATGFEVEYGGSLVAATAADAGFWMREVLLLALRWETLVIGPLISL